MEEGIRSLFAKVDREAFFRDLAPSLTPSSDRFAVNDDVVAQARHDLRAHGYLALEGLVPRERVAPIAAAIERLEEASVPASFVFAYEDVWRVVFGARQALAPIIGDDYGVMPDIWAWRVASGSRGWKPHRGTYEDNRREGAPRIINVWVALSDVTIDSACMHVVPLDRDPHVPHDLKRIEYDPAAVVPLPVRAGTLLAWSSNVLHWGGEMTPLATGPRMSLSVTLRAPAEPGDVHGLSFRERLDLLAQMITIYGHHEGPELDAAREWARLTLTMKQLAHR